MTVAGPAQGDRRAWTLLAVLGPAAEYLAAAGVPDARLNAERLLAHLLGMSRLELYLQYERPLDEAERAAYRALLRRRHAREPLQHIIGETEFWSLPFTVRPGVFIPRPETEVLVERVLARLAADWPPPAAAAPAASGAGAAPPAASRGDAAPALRALELGAGAGVVAVVLAHERPDLRVWASDTSPAALALAAENAARNGVGGRVVLEETDGLPASDGEPVHLVVSNPPYVRPDEKPGLPPEVADHDPPAALFGGEDGLDFYRRLAAEAPARLVPGGLLAVEIGATQGEAVKGIFAAAGLADVAVSRDYAGRDRVVVATRP
ncbi:MAG: peptide chain release factor N(5)-glutamine methyltransferase [Candidatus Krumholzibacteriota bacterium]|nr:peptide chain release factor N(5)-glutamine methyltransferase [Candidatus Krumholzibacteriota bacterium]